MALTKNKARKHKTPLHRALNVVQAKAATVYFTGMYIVREAAAATAIPGDDAAGVVPLGVLVEPMFPDDPDLARNHHLDNTSGADGVLTHDTAERVLRYAQNGEWEFDVSAGTPMAGEPAFLVDDDTVSAAATTNSIIAGHFTRPGTRTGAWFVDISRRGI